MPPYVPRKRLRNRSPKERELSQREIEKGKGKTAAAAGAAPPRKPTLFNDLDAATSSSAHGQSLLAASDDETSLSSLSDADFEDIPLAKRPKLDKSDDEDDDEDEDLEFEDVAVSHIAAPEGPAPSGDLELTLHRDSRVSLTNPYGTKKGPSKRERAVRTATHCVHVQFLLWHNAIRNSWLCDQEVQAIMMSHIPPRLWVEIDRWRRNSGLENPAPKTENKGKRGGSTAKGKKTTNQMSRDWNPAARRLEEGAVDMSHGDPLFRLMKSLVAWWKQRFRIIAPGLRKLGYMSLERLDRLTKAYKAEDYDVERFGEQIKSLDDFRRHAQDCSGSRDAGAQLFTALLRALGLEARMVANLQPLGFGWNKLEDADPEPDEAQPSITLMTDNKENQRKGTLAKKAAKKMPPPATQESSRIAPNPDDSEEFEIEGKDSDDDLILNFPVSPSKEIMTKKYDKDLDFPHYWTEVLSPVTKKYLAVDPLVKNVIATNRELIESLEPRGSKAEKARQVMAYIVGFSEDGTAKDVTVRYLKRHMFPGRTKGVRMPVEKVPVYNRHGKVRRYEQFDWFKAVMRGYSRGSRKNPITEVDQAEDWTDLNPAEPEKREVKEGEETLQYYKASKEFVLERHLKREEALLPDAAPVRVFRGKGKGGQVEEEMVYLRSEVVQVKSAETWHKQGRAPIEGEQPLKLVPYRAATTNRRRQIAEAEATSGKKVLQGLYSFDQTDWIIPPPIKDGIIPKNEYGNIDLFVEHMCPEGAVHIPFRGAMRVCKRLQIDFAEAVVDFEFGHRMAVPVIQGVVVARENHDLVMEELQKDEAERARKEDEKRRKTALGNWRKFIMGMRIAERIRRDYGVLEENVEVFGHRDAGPMEPENGEDMAGGFLPEGYEEEKEHVHEKSGFFAVADDEDGHEDPLVVEGHQDERVSAASADKDLAESYDEPSEVTAREHEHAVGRSRPSRTKKIVTYKEDVDDEDDDWDDGIE